MARQSEVVARRAAGRGAMLSMALCVMVLIASEFMPVSLLTPIASAAIEPAVSPIFSTVTEMQIWATELQPGASQNRTPASMSVGAAS